MTRVCLLIAVALLLIIPPAAAAPLRVLHTPDNFWHSYIDDTEGNAIAGCPYWDGNSWDTISDADDPGLAHDHGNVGSLLEGHVPVTNVEPMALDPEDVLGDVVKFITHDDHSATDGFAFENNAGPATYRFKMIAEVTEYDYSNVFGWAPLDNPDDKHVIFTGDDERGEIRTVQLPASFFFYYEDGSHAAFYRTNADGQQFALFKAHGVFVIGLEDLVGQIGPWGPGMSDYDYNDMMVAMVEEPVPEPATLVLLGSGLLGIGLAARRSIRRR